MCLRVADETTGNKDMHGSAARLQAAIGRACVLPACLSPPRLNTTTPEPQNACWSLFRGERRFEQLAGFVVHLQTIGTTLSREAGFPVQSLLAVRPFPTSVR
ncbi:hypothetical protein E4T44_08363 [Aureobasidium sp. EXF-8845]|nr:hypothetical protein E4T44_08363 [Aureobasidium sp. EXF-8845]KAI4844183.1 hypothetical protein E4T45_08259 [Aureobasidium sp. EXF-8846]